MASTLTLSPLCAHSFMGAPHRSGPVLPPPKPTAPILPVDSTLLNLYNSSAVKNVDEAALSTIIRDIDAEPSLVPLLALGLRHKIQKYYAALPAVSPSLLAELKTEFTIVKIIKDNKPFFEVATQELIAKCL